jgi:hypothetical protein
MGFLEGDFFERACQAGFYPLNIWLYMSGVLKNTIVTEESGPFRERSFDNRQL